MSGQLDANFNLVEPNVGDGEVTKIEFKNPDVILEIKLDPAIGPVSLSELCDRPSADWQDYSQIAQSCIIRLTMSKMWA